MICKIQSERLVCYTERDKFTSVPQLTTRRTQEQRRAETRAKLLDATIESLIEVGYEATTTRAVANRAGVSSGAQTHHFPRRVDLVAAAVENLVEHRIVAMRAAAARLPEELDARVDGMLDLLWADFSGPVFKVFVKLWVAADDDPELYQRLVPLERMLARTIAAATAELLADVVNRPDFDALVLTALATCRGLALSESFEPRGRRRGAGPWATVKPVMKRALLA
jgi:AcrR family transcriptional regulator